MIATGPPRKGKGACPAPVPNPLTSPQNNSGSVIAQVCAHPNLTHWEKRFLKGIAHRTRLSPTQKKIISRIIEQYLKEQTP